VAARQVEELSAEGPGAASVAGVRPDDPNIKE